MGRILADRLLSQPPKAVVKAVNIVDTVALEISITSFSFLKKLQ